MSNTNNEEKHQTFLSKAASRKEILPLHKLVILMIILIVVIIALVKIADSGVLVNSHKGETEYKSLDELKASVDFDFYVPEVITNSKIKSYTNEFGLVAYVQCSDKAFKASQFSNYNVDNLNLYEESTVDNYYKVTNENKHSIKYARYRQGYENDNNITILNWFTDKIEYSMIVYEPAELTEMLDKAEISDIEIEVTTLDDMNSTLETSEEETSSNSDEAENGSTEAVTVAEGYNGFVWKVKNREVTIPEDDNVSFIKQSSSLNIFRNSENIANLYIMENNKVVVDFEKEENISEKNKEYYNVLKEALKEYE